mgnify:CR=1 FL=1
MSMVEISPLLYGFTNPFLIGKSKEISCKIHYEKVYVFVTLNSMKFLIHSNILSTISQ